MVSWAGVVEAGAKVVDMNPDFGEERRRRSCRDGGGRGGRCSEIVGRVGTIVVEECLGGRCRECVGCSRRRE